MHHRVQHAHNAERAQRVAENLFPLPPAELDWSWSLTVKWGQVFGSRTSGNKEQSTGQAPDKDTPQCEDDDRFRWVPTLGIEIAVPDAAMGKRVDEVS